MPRFSLSAVVPALLCVAACAAPASAISPQNPYRSFNLSGVNYGSMEWERAQREGRRVWPYYNAPTSARTGVGTAAPQPRRAMRRWRR